jgi:NAD(P)H-dependent flavin oxidoreductase YrpB (nitropropane dioxygenase family)
MAWITGAEMAAAVCQAGGLGTIAAATFQPEELRQEISRLRLITAKPFAVNIPLRLASAKEAIEVVFEEEVPVIVFSAGDTDTTVIGRFTGLEFRVFKNQRAREILALERQGEEKKGSTT